MMMGNCTQKFGAKTMKNTGWLSVQIEALRLGAIKCMRKSKRPTLWQFWLTGTGSVLLVAAIIVLAMGIDRCLSLLVTAIIFITLGVIIGLDLPSGD
jgi:hypothetical protein